VGGGDFPTPAHFTTAFEQLIASQSTCTCKCNYRVTQCLCPRQNWDLTPPPFPQANVSPPGTKGWGVGYTLACVCGVGWGGSQFGRLEKRLSAPSTLWKASSSTLLLVSNIHITAHLIHPVPLPSPPPPLIEKKNEINSFQGTRILGKINPGLTIYAIFHPSSLFTAHGNYMYLYCNSGVTLLIYSALLYIQLPENL
jgi:hypothetical protein